MESYPYCSLFKCVGPGYVSIPLGDLVDSGYIYALLTSRMSITHTIAAEAYEDSFTHIAIHTPLEDYALAYTLNASCGLHLKRSAKDVQLGQNCSFATFEWEDRLHDLHWMLIANICVVQDEVAEGGFFAGHIAPKTHYFVAEQKKAAYVLKVNTADTALVQPHLNVLKTLPRISAAYPVLPHR